MKQPTLSDSRRAWQALVAAVSLAALAGWLLVGGGLDRFRPGRGPTDSSAEVGQAAADFSLDSVSGEQVRLSDYRGEIVMLNFWATWCVPCRAEMPEIESTYRAHREQGFQVLAINVQETAEEVQPFLAELGLSFPALLDRDGAVSRLYRARGLPSSFLVDRQGVVRFVRVGPLTGTMLEDQLRRLGI